MSEKDEESKDLEEPSEEEIKKLEKLERKEEEAEEAVEEFREEEPEEEIEKPAEEIEKSVEEEEIVTEEPEEKPEQPEIELKIATQEGLSGYVLINEGEAENINAMEGSVVEFEDPLSGTWGVALARPDIDTPVGEIVMEPSLCEACGLDEDFEVTVSKFIGKPQKIIKIVFGVEALSGSSEDAIQGVVEAKEKFQEFLDHRVVFKDWVLKWPQKEINIHISSTEPSLSGKQIGVINFSELQDYEIKPWRTAVPFNAILLIDVSRSMLTEDMTVTNITPAVEAIKTLGAEIPELKEFLDQFKEGEKVKRASGAVFAALLYLVEKVGRGYGEKIAVITYSETADPLTFLMTGGKKLPYFHPGKSKMSGVSQLGRLIIDRLNKVSSSHTNMSGALTEASNMIKLWEKETPQEKKPSMIVLLSDGYPDFWEEGPPVEMAHKYFAERNDVVIFTVGIGSEVQDRIMEAIAKAGRGVFFKAEDLGKMLNWYQKLARDLIVRLEVE
ncbi:MAG: VWA domain-containing protein [Candidatus Lokiarchaeia archaeon]